MQSRGLTTVLLQLCAGIIREMAAGKCWDVEPSCFNGVFQQNVCCEFCDSVL